MELSEENEINAVVDATNTTQAIMNDRFIGDRCCEYICQRLKHNYDKTDVQLRGNYIASTGALAIGDLLKINSHITSLSLEWNTIGQNEMGIASIASALEINTTLTMLDLRNNHISPEGAKCLARSLNQNASLVHLDLRWNDIGNDGVEAFIDVLNQNNNKSLIDIKVNGNRISDDIIERLENTLKLRDENDTVMQNEFQRVRTKVNDLESELMKKEHDIKSMTSAEVSKLKSMEDAKTYVESELQKAAKKVTELEHELITKNAMNSELDIKLEAEQNARQNLEKLMEEHDVLLNDSNKRCDRITIELDELNVERRKHSEIVSSLRDELKSKESLLNSINLEKDKGIASKQAFQNEIVQLQNKNALLISQIDDQQQQIIKIQHTSKKQLNDSKNMYDERFKTMRNDFDQHIKSAEERAQQAESDRRIYETSKDSAQRELSRIRLELEEKLSEQARKIRGEITTRHDSEIKELQERIDVLVKTREIFEDKISTQTSELEEVRSRITSDLRDYGKNLKDLREELEKAHAAAREYENQSSKLQIESVGLQLKVSKLEQEKIEMERDKVKHAELYKENIQKLKENFEEERQVFRKELHTSRQQMSHIEESLQEKTISVTIMEQKKYQQLNNIESELKKGIVKLVQNLCATARDDIQQLSQPL